MAAGEHTPAAFVSWGTFVHDAKRHDEDRISVSGLASPLDAMPL
jgi:hypothetical protein